MGIVTPKKIVIITAGQPSLNPRLVKEADLLCEYDYDVKVIYAYWNVIGAHLNGSILPQKKWKAVIAGGDPESKPLTYFLSRLLFKSANLFTKFTGSMALSQLAIARSAYFLLCEAKRHPADLYIGHNLGALPATVAAAKKYSMPCSFDAEDFHRYEGTDDPKDYEVKLKTNIEDKYLPQLTCFSTSTIQIASAYQKLYPQLNPIVLTNVFPKSNFSDSLLTPNIDGPLKLFWFSQTIGPKRGLETMISALASVDFVCEVHLLGSCTEDYQYELNKSNVPIYFHLPIAPDNIPQFALQFDIGLALEPGFSLNNNISLTNKIFTYMQSGLAIIASNTEAQDYLLTKHPSIGKVFEKGNASSLVSVITYYHQDRKELLKARMESLKIALIELNWENEGQKLLRVINSLLVD